MVAQQGIGLRLAAAEGDEAFQRRPRTADGKDFEGISQFTVVFLKRDGAWKIVSDQATLIKKE